MTVLLEFALFLILTSLPGILAALCSQTQQAKEIRQWELANGYQLTRKQMRQRKQEQGF